MAKDLVCGMEVNEKTAQYKSIEASNVYYFCSSSCQTEFSKDPEKYTREETKEHHASHHGGYCGVGCGAPVRGAAWYFYIGLLFLLLLLLLLRR